MMIEYCQTRKNISLYDIMEQQMIPVSKCSDSNENKLKTLILTMCHWNDRLTMNECLLTSRMNCVFALPWV